MVFALGACVHEPVVDPAPPDNPGENTGGTPCDPDVIYFERDILPILRSNCAKSTCHDVASHQEDIILDSYQNVMASDIVKPFDLGDSELFEVITETDPEKRMPEPPNESLSADQIALIAQWIQQGAKALTCDDPEGPCITDNISYAAFVAPLLSANCVGCHSGGTPSGNIVLNSHSAVQTVALNGRLLGAITWASGYPQMPQGSAKLSACNIEKIKAWINNGAPNN
jgi:hypothetical protein